MSTLTCTTCGQTYRYTSEVENTGTMWHPTVTFFCPHCGNRLTFDWRKQDPLFQRDPPQNEQQPRHTGPGGNRDYWLKMYVKENAGKLGLSDLEGPLEDGPDFWGDYCGDRAAIVVERDCSSYSGRETGGETRQADVIVTLVDSGPATEMRGGLPGHVVRVDVSDFIEWYRARAKQRSDAKRIQRITDMITEEFQRKYRLECPDREGDQAACPYCNTCAYFEPLRSFFEKLTTDFVASYKYPIDSDDFKLAQINPYHIDQFWDSFGLRPRSGDHRNASEAG